MLLIFQSSSFKIDVNRKLPKFGLFETNRSVGAKPLKRCANIIADSETFKRYGDFDTWVGRLSNWNGGVTIFSHYFLTNVVITGYLSYSFIALLCCLSLVTGSCQSVDIRHSWHEGKHWRHSSQTCSNTSLLLHLPFFLQHQADYQPCQTTQVFQPTATVWISSVKLPGEPPVGS